MADKIQIRRDSASNWTSVNPTLVSGEIGYETDTQKLKIGNATTAWTSLPYTTLGALGYAPLASPTFTGAVNASGTLQIAGAAITSTAAELNLLDGVTSLSPGQVKAFTASGAIASGKPVILNTNGTVTQISGDLESLGTQTDLTQTGNTASQKTKLVYDPNSSKLVFFYWAANSNPTAIVGSVSGTAVSWGTPVTIDSTTNADYRFAACVDTTNNKIVVHYRTGANNTAGTTDVARAGTISGMSISFGPAVTTGSYNSNATTNVLKNEIIAHTMAFAGSGKVVIHDIRSTEYDSNDHSLAAVGVYDSGNNRYNFGTWANTIKVSGSNANDNGGGSGRYALLVYYGVAGKVALVSANSLNINVIRIGTISGTNTLSWGDYVQVNYDVPMSNGMDWNPDDSKMIIAYDDANSKLNYRTMSIAANDAMTFGVEAEVHDGTNKHDFPWTTQVTYVTGSGNKASVIGYAEDTTYDEHYYKTATINGTALNLSTQQTMYAELQELFLYEQVSTGGGKLVFIYGHSTTTKGTLVTDHFYSKVLTLAATPTNLTATNYLGIAQAAIASSATGDIMLKGGVSSKLSSLTIGSDYYVAPDGTFTTIATNNQAAGKAVSATTLLMKGH